MTMDPALNASGYASLSLLTHPILHPLLSCTDDGVDHGHAHVLLYLLINDLLKALYIFIAHALHTACM